MTYAVGPITQNSVGSNSASLSCAAASGGTGPYTYQWYRSTTNGFSPGGSNDIPGATSLDLEDTGLIPNTVYYYVVRATDTGNSNTTVDSVQKTVTTAAPSQNPNQFQQSPTLGMIDMRFPYNTVSVEIDADETGTLYPGTPVKMVDSSGGVPKVEACAADSDECLGFINFNIKNQYFTAGMPCEISMGGNVMFLYATEAIARGAQVCLDLANNGVKAVSGSGGENVVGWAYDKASAMGDLIRVWLVTPSFSFDA